MLSARTVLLKNKFFPFSVVSLFKGLYFTASALLMLGGAGDVLYMLFTQGNAKIAETESVSIILSQFGKAVLVMTSGMVVFVTGIVIVCLAGFLQKNTRH